MRCTAEQLGTGQETAPLLSVVALRIRVRFLFLGFFRVVLAVFRTSCRAEGSCSGGRGSDSDADSARRLRPASPGGGLCSAPVGEMLPENNTATAGSGAEKAPRMPRLRWG